MSLCRTFSLLPLGLLLLEFCHLGFPRYSLVPRLKTLRKIFPGPGWFFLCPTGFIFKQGRGSVCSFPFLVVSVAFLCFYPSLSCAGVRASAGAGFAVPDSKNQGFPAGKCAFIVWSPLFPSPVTGPEWLEGSGCYFQ